MNISEKQDRNVLSEGRNWGLGFAFCKKVDSTSYETIQPISACKDYLNDVIFIEYRNKPITACGLKLTEKSGLFDNKLKAFLAIKILPIQYEKSYHFNHRNYEDDKKLLASNYTNIQKFVNYFEEKFNFKTRTTIHPVNDDMYLVKFSKKWCTSTYAISLYSFLLRVAQDYKGEDPIDYLEEQLKTNFDEKSLISCFLDIYDYLIEDVNYLFKQDLSSYDTYPWSIHGVGFYSKFYRCCKQITKDETTRRSNYFIIENKMLEEVDL